MYIVANNLITCTRNELALLAHSFVCSNAFASTQGGLCDGGSGMHEGRRSLLVERMNLAH